MNPRLSQILKAEFGTTNRSLPDILKIAFRNNLRDLLPDVERLATESPNDYESSLAYSSGGEPKPVEGRLHLARKISDVWRADDPVTRIRTLLAYASTESIENEYLEILLAGDVPKLDPSAKNRIDQFVSEMNNEPAPENRPDSRLEITQLIRSLMERDD